MRHGERWSTGGCGLLWSVLSTTTPSPSPHSPFQVLLSVVLANDMPSLIVAKRTSGARLAICSPAPFCTLSAVLYRGLGSVEQQPQQAKQPTKLHVVSRAQAFTDADVTQHRTGGPKSLTAIPPKKRSAPPSKIERRKARRWTWLLVSGAAGAQLQ